MDKEPHVYITKAATAWGGVGVANFLDRLGIATWGDAAAAMAFVYSCLLVGEWVYKKFFKRKLPEVGHRDSE